MDTSENPPGELIPRNTNESGFLCSCGRPMKSNAKRCVECRRLNLDYRHMSEAQKEWAENQRSKAGN